MNRTFNWGIIGPGKIAHKFAQDLSLLPGAKLHAVASRSLEKAQDFARTYGAPHAFGSYEEIVHCPGLDVVYVATPHSGHFANALLCLENRIPVLVEKPFTINAKEAKILIDAAKQHQTFLMEAFWTRFLPTIKTMLDLIEEGRIGRVTGVKADFGFHSTFDPESRLYNRALGGGALLDIGVYPVFLALLLFGRPQEIKALATLSPTMVDEEIGILFRYAGGEMAHLHASVRSQTKTEAFIYGETGTIHLHTRWHEPTSMTILHPDSRPEYLQWDFHSKGYAYEAVEVMNCLIEGQLESADLPLSFSLDLMETLDAIRTQVGLTYPGHD